ncbi:MAG TPA: hypothetical protein VLE27_15855, partial [Thermoanaerobaculia bacterium]|nr:hypothetical protein [Thermoanaerobaculia bacterium]
MNDHPTVVELRAFVQGGLNSDRRRAVLMHLFQGCTTCRAAASETFGYSPIHPDVYDGIIGKVFRKVKRIVKREQEETRPELPGLEKGQSQSLPQRNQKLNLYHELLDRSWALRHENPKRMVELAWRATEAARALDPEVCGAENVADHQCRAYMELANAYRVAEDLEEAEQAFRRAEELFEKGTHNITLKVRLLDLRASYHADRRELEKASAALDTVHAIYSQLGDEHHAGRTLIMKGIYTGLGGNAEEAVRLTSAGLGAIHPDRDPILHFTGVHNLARWLMDSGDLQEARAVLGKNRWRQEDAGGPLNLLKLRWLEAQIHAGLQEFDRAERGFLEVKQGFLEVEKPYDAAVASLDLATLWLHQGRTTDAKAASLEAYEIFRSLGIPRESTGAFLVLTKAFQM